MTPKKIIDSFIASACDGRLEVFLKGASSERLLEKLSLLGVDAHNEMKYLDKLRIVELGANPNASDFLRAGVQWKLGDALKDLFRNADTMDFALDYILRNKNVYVIHYINKGLCPVPRPLVRLLDGSFRSEAALGELATSRQGIENLIHSAVSHFDAEALRYILSLPTTSRMFSDEAISNEVKWNSFIKNDGAKYKEIFKEFLVYRKVEDLSVAEYLESFDLWESEFDENDADSIYNETVVKKGPEEILDMILRAGRQNPVGANQFVLRMIQSGIDCYPGFIKGTENQLGVTDVLPPAPRDYQAMLDICLSKLSRPGFKALIAAVPLTEIAVHPRKRVLANMVFELTGNSDAVKLMSKKSRGRALDDALGL
jgi:hypothetical protein